jgi:hypothetical protein
MLACCSCLILPNGLLSLSVKNDLLNNPFPYVPPPATASVVIKLLANRASTAQTNPPTPPCTAGTVGIGNNVPVPGMVAYGTTLHSTFDKKNPTYTVTETKFTSATLSAAELTTLNLFVASRLLVTGVALASVAAAELL